MSRRLLSLSLSVVAGLFAVACGAQKDVAAADKAVIRFHAQLDNQDFTAMYDQADPQFRKVSKQEDFVALMTAIHKKLGHVESAARQGLFWNDTTSGLRIRLTYNTKFSDGDAQEQFVWTKNGDNLVLLGYNINSNALITK
jgi:Protein of unknown function (DUF4019)